MAKKIQMMSHDKEWQVVDGVETLVPVEQFDIDPITDSSCVKIEGFRTLEETLNEKNMFTPEVNATKVMDKVGGEYHQNVVDGAYEEAILYGNTQVNLCEEDTSVALQIPTTFTSFNNGELQINNKENQVVAPLIKGVTMVNLAQTNSASITSGNATVIRNVKGNTVYTLSFTFTTKNTNSGVTIQCYDGNGTFIENTIHKTGLGDVVKFTFTTHANAAKIHICNNPAYGGETIQLDEIMLIEGDQTALDIPFFKGMKSVELVRPLTNLFTNDLAMGSLYSGTGTNSNGTVTSTSTNVQAWTGVAFSFTTLKQNTRYLVMWDSLSSTQTSSSNTEVLIGIYHYDGTTTTRLGTISNNELCPTKRSLMFDTQNYNVSEITLRVHATLSNTETGTTTVTGLRVFEYDDYLRSVDLQSIGWFSGTKNVAIEPIKTCSKNLYPYGDINFTPTSTGWFDAKGSSQMTGDIASKSHSRFLLKKGTYYFSIESNTNAFCQLTNDKENMGVNANSSFTLQEDTYVTLRVKVTTANTSATVTNIQIERGETATAYVAHDSRYYEPNGQNTIVLRSLPSGVCDTFNLQTGEYVQNIGETVLDGVTGTQDWQLDGTNETTGISGFYLANSRMSYNFGIQKNQCVISNEFKTIPSTEWKNRNTEACIDNTGNIAFLISNSKLSEVSGNGFKQYLQQNPITVQYQLATPITTIIPRTIKRNYNGTVSTVDFQTYTNKENFRLPKNPSYLTINSMTSIKPVVEPITYFDFKTRLKANTDYTIKLNKETNAVVTTNLGGTSVVFNTGDTQKLVKTPIMNLQENLRISGSGSIQNIMVIEGDVLNKELPYFNGMCNVKMPIVRNCGKNFCPPLIMGSSVSNDNGTIITNSEVANRARTDYIRISPFNNYIISGINNTDKTLVCFYDANKNFISRTSGTSHSRISLTPNSTSSSATYTIPRNTSYIILSYYGDNLSVLEKYKTPIQIEITNGTEASNITSYEPYKGNDICLVQGEIGLSQDMFESGGYGTGNGGTKYEDLKYVENSRTRIKTYLRVKPSTSYRLTYDGKTKFNHREYDINGAINGTFSTFDVNDKVNNFVK